MTSLAFCVGYVTNGSSVTAETRSGARGEGVLVRPYTVPKTMSSNRAPKTSRFRNKMEEGAPALFMIRMSISMNTLHGSTISMSTACLLLLLV